MGDARPWTYAALFGTLWGALELTLGTALHLAGVPLYGVLMNLICLVCLVTLRRLQPRAGVCLLAGAVAIFLKIFALGGLRVGPMVGIGLGALLVELGFSVCGTTALGAVVGGALTVVAAPLQMFLVLLAVLGREGLASSFESLTRLAAVIGLEPVAGEVAAAAVAGAAALVGGAGGWWSWRLAGRVERRLGRAP
jgi:hypothetical protein